MPEAIPHPPAILDESMHIEYIARLTYAYRHVYIQLVIDSASVIADPTVHLSVCSNRLCLNMLSVQ